MLRSPGKCVRRGRRGVWLSAVLVALVAMLVSAVFASVAGSASRAAGLLAFTRDDGIYVMGVDGSGVRRIRRNAGSGIAWSPDGRRIAVVVGDGAIAVMNADGSDFTRLALPEGVRAPGSPTWSPDGRTIAFSAFQPDPSAPEPGGDRDVWVTNADGSEPRLLVRTPGLWESEVDWSPTGRQLVVTAGGWLPRLWTMNVDGTNIQRLAGHSDALDPEWSPDGRTIAYARNHYYYFEWDICVIGLDGQPPHRLSSAVSDMDRHPTWSPDGRRIAFARWAWPTLTEKWDIYVMQADGTQVKRLTQNRPGHHVWDLAWQPSTAH